MPHHPSKKTLRSWLHGLAAVTLLLTAACGGAPEEKPQAIPDSLRPPSGSLLTLQTYAKGVQIYECKPSAAGASVPYQWVFKAPEATLYDQTKNKIAHHYAGPTWEGSDGSVVVGEVTAKADSPDGKSIPWLLLRAKSVAGRGRFGAVKYIQRVHTSGGNPPPSCKAEKVGDELRVSYTADYYFFVESRT